MKRLEFSISVALVSLGIFILSPSQTSATNIQPLTQKQMIRGSDSIIIGEVVDQYSDWEETGRFIVTYVRLKVVEDIKGSEEGSYEVVVKSAGGKVGDREMIVHGAPRFETGEKALLFLRRNAEGLRKVMGLSLGKLRIIKDEYSGEEVAVNPGDSELRFVSVGSNGKIGPGKPAKLWKPTLLKDLVDDIKNELEGGNNIN